MTVHAQGSFRALYDALNAARPYVYDAVVIAENRELELPQAVLDTRVRVLEQVDGALADAAEQL